MLLIVKVMKTSQAIATQKGMLCVTYYAHVHVHTVCAYCTSMQHLPRVLLRG